LVKLRYAFDRHEYGRVREWLLMLCKRRGQAKKSTVDMIDLVMNTFLNQLPTREEKFTFLQTLREACEGKMFLEREYASCTRKLIEMLEEDGKTDEAALTIQEIQIETYGSLKNQEKVDFILYQMKLVLQRNDFVRLQILSRKISKKAINEKGLETQKIQYFTFLVKYYINEKEIMDVARSYQTIFETYSKAEEALRATLDPTGELKAKAFQNYIIYLMIAPYSDDKINLLKEIETTYPREFEAEELLAKFVKKFLTFEICPFSEGEVEQQMLRFEPFQEMTHNAKTHMIELFRQMIQHNIRVMERYYSRIKLDRLSILLGVSVERTEVELGDMVVKKRIAAKINRLEGLVVFSKKKQFTNERLT